MLYKACNSTWL